MNISEAMKPCRHGKQPRVCHDIGGDMWAITAACKECGSTDWHNTKSAAITAWDTRHSKQPSVDVDMVERVAREAVDKFQRHPAGAWGDDDAEMALLCVARLAAQAALSATQPVTGDAGWLFDELKQGIANIKEAMVKTKRGDVFWNRYWDGYLKGYESLLSKAKARTALAKGEGK